jgi:predicted enzyme related to lactoylglutathione lyase
MLNFSSILLFSENPAKLAAFYKEVFQKDAEWNNGGYSGWKVGVGMFMVGPHDKVKGKSKNPERLILNFETPDVEKEFARIEKLGAKVIAKPYHPGEEPKMLLATLADPDGNFFQLATPMS